MASCMLSILDTLKLYDSNSLELHEEILSEVMFRKMKAYDIDLNEELGFDHLKPVPFKKEEISKEQESQSKKLALWLRHKPELICDVSEVREGGWIPWSFVVKGGIKLEMLKKIVEDDDKGRYELDEKHQWVRACQGHSFEVKMDYEVVSDIPEKLYHGTVEVVIPIVMKEGLKPMSRTHVHLSPDFDTAIKVGSRRGTPVILEIDAQEMVESGEELLVSNNGVYLCKKVDPKFITILR